MNDLQSPSTEITPAFLQSSDESLKTARLRMLLSLACEWYWQTDTSLKFCWLSRGALHLTGVLSSDLIGKAIWKTENLIPAFNVEWASLQKTLDERKTFQNFIVCYLSSLNKLVILALSGAPMFSEEGEFLGYAGLAHHLPSNKEQSNKSLRLTHCDPLTGEANRKVMEDSFTQGWALAKRKGKTVGIIMIRFPEVLKFLEDNSLIVIQETLLKICSCITQYIRKSDIFGRIELDQFCILLQDITQDLNIQRIKKHVIMEFESKPIEINNKEVYLKPEIVYLIPENNETFENIIGQLQSLLPQQ